jgi:hypothetical protein
VKGDQSSEVNAEDDAGAYRRVEQGEEEFGEQAGDEGGQGGEGGKDEVELDMSKTELTVSPELHEVIERGSGRERTTTVFGRDGAG